MNSDLILIALALFTWGLGESAFLSFQPLYLQQLGANPVQIGAIISGFGITATIAHIPAGYLADRWGRKPVILAAWTLGIIAAGVMALATTLPGLVTGVLIYGLTMFVLAPMNAYVTAARGKLSVQRALTLIPVSYYFGAIFGPSIGGMVGDRYGFRLIFAVATGIFILSLFFLLAIHPQPVEPAVKREVRGSLLANTPFLIFLGVYFLAVFAMYLPQPLSPNFLQNERGLSLTEIGRLYSITGIGIVVFNLILGQFESRRGFLIGQAGTLLFAILLWLGTGLPWFALGYFVLGGFRAARSLATAQVRTLVHPSMMGLAYGMAETFNSTATILAPLLAGTLYEINPQSIYPISACLIVLALLFSAGSIFRRPAPQVIEEPAS